MAQIQTGTEKTATVQAWQLITREETQHLLVFLAFKLLAVPKYKRFISKY